MLSRVANLIYWTARYLERAENTARLLDVNSQLALDLQTGDTSEENAWKPMIAATGDEKRFKELYGELNQRNVVDFMIFNRENSNSIAASIACARENARCVREQLSSETWEQLNRLYLRLKHETYDHYQQVGSSEFLTRTKLSIQLFYGIAANMLPHNEGWSFFEIGRSLERADFTSRLIDLKYFTLLPSVDMVGTAIDAIQWGAVLRSCSAFEAFRKSRRGLITPDRVTDYLILDEHFPRSIRYGIVLAEEAIRQVTRDSERHFSNDATRSLGRLRADLDYCQIRDIVSFGLHEWIDSLQEKIGVIHKDIESTFFFYDTAGAKVLS